MSKKSSKAKNKPRPPTSPGSKREDPAVEQRALPSEQPEPSDQKELYPEKKEEPSSSQTEPSEKKESPSEQKKASPEQKESQPELKPETKDLPAGPSEPSAGEQNPPSEQPANTSPPSAPTDTRPTGGRKGKTDDELSGVTDKVGDVVPGGLPNAGLQIPGAPVGEEDKSSLKIKIHLNIHAKVRLELDAQIYGDIVIGLL
ncbi:uncharacterized protein N7483_008114 [Penicillium malachiteum]|uniref:uncharacterized protein n=1 Tax=Penicillium malachiteum TaxID=1324776 RepID=UPI002547B46F|nr:uncharacterized protein N7483_008114 [Penicillium malachiteum]KAJ5726757.1 hypothetical protein N7483_008114 [Penicillium malachiteum]